MRPVQPATLSDLSPLMVGGGGRTRLSHEDKSIVQESGVWSTYDATSKNWPEEISACIYTINLR